MGVDCAFERLAAFQGLLDDLADAPLGKFLLAGDLVKTEAFAQPLHDAPVPRGPAVWRRLAGFLLVHGILVRRRRWSSGDSTEHVGAEQNVPYLFFFG